MKKIKKEKEEEDVGEKLMISSIRKKGRKSWLPLIIDHNKTKKIWCNHK